MKICYFFPKMGIGRAERHVLSLAEGLLAGRDVKQNAVRKLVDIRRD